MDVGGYRIVSLLAESRLGRVHLARSASGRPVAVRTVPARLATDQAFRERFRREAAVGRAVTGRYAGRRARRGPDAEEPWVAIEFCAGPGLPEAVATHGPLGDAELGALGAALAEALAGVHAAGVPHRDVKPSMSSSPLTARSSSASASRSPCPPRASRRTAGPSARPASSPPSCWRAMSGRAPPPTSSRSARSYAVAATGRGPFGSGRGPEVLSRTLHEEPDLLGVPGAAWPWFIGRCLTRDPAERPSVAETLAWCAGRAVTPPWWETEPVADLIRVQEEEVAELLAWAEEGAEARDTGDPYAAAAGHRHPRRPRTGPREQPTVPAAPRDPRVPWR